MTITKVQINQDLLQDVRQAAASQRRLWQEQGTLVVNLVSSPGAGKTTLLQAISQCWANRIKMGVLVGDLATDRDAERLRPFVPVEQLTTGGACHLELPLVLHGLKKLTTGPFDVLFIENIGNLVCPASHDLGEHLRVVALSSTEGDDKPGKYPKMFRTSQVMVMTKSDLLPYVPFSPTEATADARRIQPDIRTFLTSAIRSEGIAEFCQFLEDFRLQLINQKTVSAKTVSAEYGP